MVTAHDLKKSAEKAYKQAGSPAGVSPERVLYTVFVNLNKQPNFIRVREGNTLALLVPETETSAIFLMYNADKLSNLKDNLIKLLYAASKMGYKKVWGPLAPEEYGNDMVQKIYKQLEQDTRIKVNLFADKVEAEIAP